MILHIHQKKGGGKVGHFIAGSIFKLLQSILFVWFHVLFPNDFRKHQTNLMEALGGIAEERKVIFEDEKFEIKLEIGENEISVEIRRLKEGENLENLIGVLEIVMEDLKRKQSGMDVVTIETNDTSITFIIPTQYL